MQDTSQIPHPMKPFEIIVVRSTEVACDGDAGPSSHPRVFLRLERETGEVVCPYCSRLYTLDKAHAAAGGH